MTKNGKTIKCKFCKKAFYIPKSRFATKKYCSRECGQSDNWGFKPRQKECVVCEKGFTISTQLELQNKTCSQECHIKNAYAISYRRSKERKIGTCKTCSNEFERMKYRIGSNKCNPCLYKEMSMKRKGKGNPNYRGGFATKSNIYTGRHLRACAKYKKEFLNEHGYLFCEECEVNTNGTPRFEVHHIYFASRYPKHKELHNPKNLILLCIQCHNDYHTGDCAKELLVKKEEERGLKQLFQ